MKPAPFTLHVPERPDEVVGLLAEHGDEAKILAGGQSLVPMLALRLARFEHLVDVNRVVDLRGVGGTNGSLHVGAGTRHHAVATDASVADRVPLLARATGFVGHRQIRNRGTLGGALAHADPAAEQPAVALALDAHLEVRSASGSRDIPAEEFFLGTWTTALADDELLTGIRFPVWSGRTGASVQELARRHGDFAIVGVVCALQLGDDDDDVRRAAIACFGVGSTPVRNRAAEAALVAGADATDAAEMVAAALAPSDDLHATAHYRRSVARVLVRRAILEATTEALA